MLKKLITIILVLSIVFLYSMNYFEEVEYFVENIKEEFSGESVKVKTFDSENKMENFKNIEIGDAKEVVLKQLGQPNRIDKCEYNFVWYVYNCYQSNFYMVGVENEKVVALFTNNINSIESENISIGQDRNYIRDNFESIKFRQKQNVRYEMNTYNEYDIIFRNRKYITVFYDKFDDNKIWAYQIISKHAEEETTDIYPKEDKEIEESYMYQVIDLINATRSKYVLNQLKISKKATKSATKHSLDMAKNDFFNHENLKHETPFDRMENENIKYRTAGENIAAGQVNPIFEHNALMNSYGHRKNILGNYKYIGVGVVFGGKYRTYYTENFFG